MVILRSDEENHELAGSLIPARERFRRYPVLYSLACFFRIVAILAVGLWVAGSHTGIYALLFTNNHWWLLHFVLVVYSAVAAIGFQLITEAICILVDIERNALRSD